MKISIIIPIYNCDKNISKCIESIINQSYKNLEIILVNDGSTDNSLFICENYALKDSRIKIINKENGGVSSARNYGIKYATGEFIQFIDADDYIHKNMSKVMIEKIINNNSDLIVCGYVNKGYNFERTITYKEKTYKNLEMMREEFSELYEKYFFHSVWNKLYKRNKIKEIFNEELSLGEDLIFNLSYLKECSSISVIEECYYNYINDSKSSLSTIYRKDIFEIMTYLYIITNSFCDNYLGSDIDKVGLERVYFNNICGALQLLIYDSSLEKKEKMNIINKWINDENVIKVSKNIKINSLEKNILKILIINKAACGIYRIFLLKKYVLKFKYGE